MIQAHISGQIGCLTLDLPERHNALDRDMIATLIEHLEDYSNNPALRSIMLTGNGRSFCSGAALDAVGSDWTENPLTALCDRVESHRLPVVCALNGGVYGGGVELALACDFRVGAPGMKMFVPAAKLGIHYTSEGISRAIARLGAQAARRVFLLGETFVGTDLARMGFLDKVVDAEDVKARAMELADRLAGHAPLALQGMKTTILGLSTNTLDREAAQARIAACFASDDHQEGLAAFAEKRAPTFNGT